MLMRQASKPFQTLRKGVAKGRDVRNTFAYLHTSIWIICLETALHVVKRVLVTLTMTNDASNPHANANTTQGSQVPFTKAQLRSYVMLCTLCICKCSSNE
eukprot:92601-Amphidinium_carterae.1